MPERKEGRHSTAQSDIYSAGALLYHMLAGHPGADAMAAPGGAVLDVARRALEKDPARRFASATQMRDALAQAEPALRTSRSVVVDFAKAEPSQTPRRRSP